MIEREKKEERMSYSTHKHNHIVEPTGRRKQTQAGQTNSEWNKTNINKRSEQRTVKIIKQTNKQKNRQKSYFYTRVQNQTQNKNKKESKQLPNVKR